MQEFQHRPSIASSSSYLATGLIEPGLGYNLTHHIEKKQIMLVIFQRILLIKSNKLNPTFQFWNFVQGLWILVRLVQVWACNVTLFWIGMLFKSVTPLVQTKDGFIKKDELGYLGGLVLLGLGWNELPSQQGSQLIRKHGNCLSPTS